MTAGRLLKAYADPKLSAKLARVSYASEDAPGWARQKQGRGFLYLNQKGKQIRSEKDLSRIQALHIPPAWKDVWIAPLPRAHVQVTGLDSKGRKQYRYHQDWTEFRKRVKYLRLAAFAHALPVLRKEIANALQEEDLTRRKVAAIALSLIDELSLRVGNEEYARDNKTYGVTTLQNRHISIEGDRIILSFVGKSHQEHELELKDKKLALLLQEEKELPGARLLQYVNDDGSRHALSSGDVNAFIQEVTGADFTAKDFRTWTGTVFAYERMKSHCTPESIEWTDKEYGISLRAIIKDVAERLGNTTAVTKSHYVHADLQKQYACGSFRQMTKYAARSKRLPGLDRHESEMLYLLEKFAKQA